ncbi:MAG: hypothetical protein FJ087_05555 [Deltaproteobacteria bacterium]|nr:hypothetical protein [Deltaproteobacteria bacterium]
MRILYGVVGEGMGHATRSRVVLEHLLEAGHDVRVVVSGRAHRFLVERFAGRPGISFHEIHGLHMDYADNVFLLGSSIWTNLEQAPAGILKNVEVYREVAESGFEPEMVFSDFESWAYLYGIRHRQTSSANSLLVPELRKLPWEFRVYGMGREAEMWNVRLKAFSEKGFVERSAEYAGALEAGYRPADNSMLFACVNDLCDRVAAGLPRPARLETGGMGNREGGEQDEDE